MKNILLLAVSAIIGLASADYNVSFHRIDPFYIYLYSRINVMITLLTVSSFLTFYSCVLTFYIDWGQNSYGAANGNDPSGWQQPLQFYCDDDTIDVLPISFLTTFFGVGGEPHINLANVCV